MAYGKAGYLLGRDVGISGREFEETERQSYKKQGGINLFRGIGRGLGMLGGIALAGTGAGIPLLALAGGLGSLGGSLAGRELGKIKYGDPDKAKVGLFYRDIAKKQRRDVSDYWRGMKEQIGVNALQDAVTAGMYGGKIQDLFSKGKFALGGQPAGLAIPSATPTPLLEANTAGVFAEPRRLSLLDMANKPPIPSAAMSSASTASVGGYGAGISTQANIGTGINAVPTYSTAAATTSTDLGNILNYRNVPQRSALGSAVSPYTPAFDMRQGITQANPDPFGWSNQIAGGQSTGVQQRYNQPLSNQYWKTGGKQYAN